MSDDQGQAHEVAERLRRLVSHGPPAVEDLAASLDELAAVLEPYPVEALRPFPVEDLRPADAVEAEGEQGGTRDRRHQGQ